MVAEARGILSPLVLAMAHLVYPSAPALTDSDIESKEKYNKEKES